MNINKCFKAKQGYARLDHFLSQSLPEVSRTQIVKWIKDQRVALNGRPASKKNIEINEGDEVTLEIPQPEETVYTPSFQFNRLYEDEYLLVIDKPTGLTVHKGAGEQEETVLDAFCHYYPQVKEMETAPGVAEERPGIVHRLDKDTSGILILAKDYITMKRMQKQFKRRTVQKTYLALAEGRMRFRSGTVDAPIVRSPRKRTRFIVIDRAHELAETAREAVTDYQVIWQYEDFSFLRLKPHTGRTHQLRVHLSHLGNPILGDKVYGKQETFERLALHAYAIEFTHPRTAHLIKVYSPFPAVFRQFIKKQHQK